MSTKVDKSFTQVITVFQTLHEVIMSFYICYRKVHTGYRNFYKNYHSFLHELSNVLDKLSCFVVLDKVKLKSKKTKKLKTTTSKAYEKRTLFQKAKRKPRRIM